ncbi:serine hydrolase domain-containing protein [Paenibacillus paeoniae]|uniref:Class C beta-lactamase-related serine hydrolase n=1 Tax=Paenibacillus paeoniae TaxID=2292705 RepID=A0A371PKQ7_9BACL|nr:serine hydrolase [Paenibacillus paeoniae]REK76782.1 class C beta-lactamase-related serine hydrolase [Paenibacillus paeoniae]
MNHNEWPIGQERHADSASTDMDLDKLSGLGAVVTSEYSNMNGLVMVRNGSIAHESYYNGYGPEDKHHVASVTKSVVSALIGIAIDRGDIPDEHVNVLDFFPEYDFDRADKDGQRGRITIRHLLTMTAPYPFPDWQEPLDKMCMQSDWVKYALDMLGQNGTIGAFKYATAGAHLLSAILTRSTGKSAREYANEYVFRKIGISEIPDYGMTAFGFEELFGSEVRGWVHDPGHYSTGGWGLTLTPREMARFGELYLNRGKWNHAGVISESWIEKSTAMNPNQYGYLWWLREEEGIRTFSAIGDGGNMICCLPDENLVIAIASSFMVNPSDRWPLIKQHIIPAIRG